MHNQYRLIMTRLQQAPDLQGWCQMAAIPRCIPHQPLNFCLLELSACATQKHWVLGGQDCKPSISMQTPLHCGYNVYRHVAECVMCLDVIINVNSGLHISHLSMQNTATWHLSSALQK